MATTLKYILLIFLGFLVIYVCSLLQHVPPPESGEYHYSSFLRNNYTLLTTIIFIILGSGIGYYFKLNPWGTGFCLVLIFPIVSLYEGTVYRGSHNLIPFEFVIHFLMALPSIAGVYLGKLLYKKLAEKKV